MKIKLTCEVEGAPVEETFHTEDRGVDISTTIMCDVSDAIGLAEEHQGFLMHHLIGSKISTVTVQR